MRHDLIDIKDWLKYNASLQKKKNAIRKELKERGVLKRGGKNDYDNYKYFSESQYKTLFTDLFATHGLDLKFNEIAYDTFEGTAKQANGRMPKLVFSLIDIDTGFYEETTITGEGMDKGDKAGYKAYTGALKYYLANTFLVATGDDPEAESPDAPMNNKVKRGGSNKGALINKVQDLCKKRGENVADYCEQADVKSLSDMYVGQLEDLINFLEG